MKDLLSEYCSVAVNFPGKIDVLTYKTQGTNIPVGSLVKVPLGRRDAKGVVVDFHLTRSELEETEKKYKLKEVSEIVDENYALSKNELSLYKWMSKYYHYNLGQLVWDSVPKILKRPRDVELEFGKGLPLEFELNIHQKPAYEGISTKLESGFDRFYIHGVTGSGKTLIYLNLIRETLAKGKSVLFLLPEINLTPQFTETFKKFIDSPILTYHSGVSNSHKNAVWKHLKQHDKPVMVMGVRSSVFLPVQNLGLVLVDEEHDQSFKQSDRCAYNGRDVAIKKAQISNCPIVMGSATPSLENFYTFTRMKKENYYSLKERASGGFPKIELLDSRKQGMKRSDDDLFIWPFEKQSLDLITEALDKKEQVLVFVNRLGFSNFIQCRACGYKFEDPNTGVPLRYFKNKNILSSAHSDYQIPLPEICPDCGNMNLLQKGFGTEKLQEILLEQFPNKVIERFDRDEITNIDKLESKLDRFHRGEIDIFVGTQMLSKGHNFKKVNLVLILGIDSMLNFPDFRSMEKTYQTLVQILGRSGRYSNEAKVVIQTLIPDNPMFQYILGHSFDGFYEFELAPREMGMFPPYSKIATIHVSGRFRDKLSTQFFTECQRITTFCTQKGLDVMVWGPAPAMIERRANMFTWSATLSSSDVNALHFALKYFKDCHQLDSGYSVKIDVDPMSV